jgi:hypothetical protein
MTVPLMNPTTAKRILALLVCAGMMLVGQCCTLGLMPHAKPVMKSEHGCCDQSDSRKAPARDGEQKCCCLKGANTASLPEAAAKVPANDAAPLLAMLPALALVQFPDDRNSSHVQCADTGPPRSPGFAELILQSSLLSHAPPFGA